jgi:hypothetical protein
VSRCTDRLHSKKRVAKCRARFRRARRRQDMLHNLTKMECTQWWRHTSEALIDVYTPPSPVRARQSMLAPLNPRTYHITRHFFPTDDRACITNRIVILSKDSKFVVSSHGRYPFSTHTIHPMAGVELLFTQSAHAGRSAYARSSADASSNRSLECSCRGRSFRVLGKSHNRIHDGGHSHTILAKHICRRTVWTVHRRC